MEIYRTFIEHLSNIYGKSIAHLPACVPPHTRRPNFSKVRTFADADAAEAADPDDPDPDRYLDRILKLS